MDSLYSSDQLTFGSRVLFKPIQLWQKFSYSSPALNCQFESSCSNFMVEAIQTKGVPFGLVVGTDRIVRCNPAARSYHLKSPNPQILSDGRLYEELAFSNSSESGKRPGVAVGLSVVPGLGRFYAGHPVDGIYSFIFVAGFTFNAYQHHQADNSVRTVISGGLAALIWLADFYGAYRTATLSASHP